MNDNTNDVDTPNNTQDTLSDAIGATVAPRRYNHSEREAIDILRDVVTDRMFIVFCLLTSLKYLLRFGHKDVEVQELGKAKWYRDMALHVLDPKVNKDPRHLRENFMPYSRPRAPMVLMELVRHISDRIQGVDSKARA